MAAAETLCPAACNPFTVLEHLLVQNCFLHLKQVLYVQQKIFSVKTNPDRRKNRPKKGLIMRET